jgi:uncharacterized membrane protein YphA (DoxX/SURF4 family)
MPEFTREQIVSTLIPMWVGRLAIATVWFYHGVWNKLLAPAGRHAQIVASLPAIAGLSPRGLLVAIGVGEALLACWVLAGWRPRLAAVVQTLVLVIMNVGGLIWARDQIVDPGSMIVQNFAFLVLVWIVALASTALHKHA